MQMIIRRHNLDIALSQNCPTRRDGLHHAAPSPPEIIFDGLKKVCWRVEIISSCGMTKFSPWKTKHCEFDDTLKKELLQGTYRLGRTCLFCPSSRNGLWNPWHGGNTWGELQYLFTWLSSTMRMWFLIMSIKRRERSRYTVTKCIRGAWKSEVKALDMCAWTPMLFKGTQSASGEFSLLI